MKSEINCTIGHSFFCLQCQLDRVRIREKAINHRNKQSMMMNVNRSMRNLNVFNRMVFVSISKHYVEHCAHHLPLPRIETSKFDCLPLSIINGNRIQSVIHFREIIEPFFFCRNDSSLPPLRTSPSSPTRKSHQPIVCFDLNRIIHQVNKHAAINYSYYTRTK